MKTTSTPLYIILLFPILFFGLEKTACSQIKYVLRANDMPEFTMRDASYWFWSITDTSYLTSIKQNWTNNKYKQIGMMYGEFSNEVDAIMATACDSQSLTGAYYNGGLRGVQISNSGWVSADSETAFYLQKWNIGVTIFIPETYKPEFFETQMLIANRILQRINDSIDISYKQKDIELEKYRIAESEYAGLLEPANSLLIKSGFTEFKTDCTKWIFNTDSLRMSRRVQWNNNQTFFSFDVTKFSTSDEALDAAQTLSLVSRVPFSEEIPTSMRRIPYCNLQDTNSIETAIAHCEYRKRDISVVGSISNYAILFYYYNAPAVDKLFFENVVMAINQQANTVNKSEPKPKIRIFPNPASDLINIVLSGSKNTNTIIQLIDLEGRIMRIENIGSLNEYCMNIAELNSGMYILQIKNSMDTYRKLIKIH